MIKWLRITVGRESPTHVIDPIRPSRPGIIYTLCESVYFPSDKDAYRIVEFRNAKITWADECEGCREKLNNMLLGECGEV